jgi:Tol biopolymer transport system component
MSSDVVLNVIPDPGTTADGVVVDASAAPVAGATVTCDGVGGTSGADGHFSIAGIPTVHGKLRCTAVRATPPPTLTGRSSPVAPVRGGVTDVGTITIAPGKIYYSRVAAAGQPNGTIWRANIDGSGEELVTSGSWPRLSPDEKFIVFRRDGSGITFGGTMRVRDLDAGTEVNVFSPGGDYVVNYDWTADGTKIVFDYSCAILIVPREGGPAPGFVTPTGCYDDAPARNPIDGTWAFHSNDGLYLSGANGAGRNHIPNTSGGDYWVAWSPDGQWLSFGHVASDGQTLQNYFKIHPDGSNRTQLTFLDPAGPDRTGEARAWSPDGETLLVPGTVGGVKDLYAVATNGSGAMTPIAIPAGETPDFVGGVTGAVVP